MTSISWKSNINGFWATAADWNTGTVPGASDTATIGFPVTITSAANASVGTLNLSAGASLSIDGGTTFNIVNGQTEINGGSIGLISAENGGTLELGLASNTETFTNSGSIALVGVNTATNLEIAGTVHLTGDGQLVLGGSNSDQDFIEANGSSATLDNQNNTISGGGEIGNTGGLTVDNEGVFDANSATGLPMYFFPSACVNDGGILEATTGGGLSIADGTINNTGGTIQAVGGGIVGIAFETITGSGSILVGQNSELFLDDVTITGSVQFTGPHASIFIETPSGGERSHIEGGIAGAQATDTIDLNYITYSSSVRAVWLQTSAAGGTLSLVDDSNGSTLETLTFVGQYTTANFLAKDDGSSGTLVELVSPEPLTYANDYNGDGVGDILWTNGGQLGVWTETSNLNPTWYLLSPNTGGWSVVGTGDYNGDGINDVLWENGNQLGVWAESSNLSPTWTLLSPNLNGWFVVGGGDYNGATSSSGYKVNDILFQNGQQLGVWIENSNLNPTWQLLSSNLNGWSVVGSGDYNGDGISDILFASGNQLGVWTESSNLTPTWTLLSSNTNGWSVVGSGDYTGDGFSDILWSNGNQLGIWLENGSLNPTWELLSSNTNGWSVVGSADYNGAVSSSGHTISDILWQNGNQVGVWIENSGLNPMWHLLSSNTAGWSVTGAGSPGIR